MQLLPISKKYRFRYTWYRVLKNFVYEKVRASDWKYYYIIVYRLLLFLLWLALNRRKKQILWFFPSFFSNLMICVHIFLTICFHFKKESHCIEIKYNRFLVILYIHVMLCFIPPCEIDKLVQSSIFSFKSVKKNQLT